MQEKELNCKITYNDYKVLGVRTLYKTILVKTVNKTNGEIIWFIGFETKLDITEDIKRILAEDHKYKNSYFKQMFNEDYMLPHRPINFDEASHSSKTPNIKRKEIV